MGRNVKGTLFVDYVRMLRAHKGVEWARHLPKGDLQYVLGRIDPDQWYPMETFERFGVAILQEIAMGDLDLVRAFGRASIDRLVAAHPNLIAAGDPRETLARFRVLRESFFDFSALDIEDVFDNEASATVHYQMGSIAEEAASFQTMGFFERLLEMAGAKDVQARFTSRSWRGDPDTRIELRWS